MSLFFPKRISELSTIDSDLETPEKTKNKSSTKNTIFPKRINDIKESDSEDDEEDKLNCAIQILNDSFVLTPTKDIEKISTPQYYKIEQPNKENLVDNKNHITYVKRNDSIEQTSKETAKCISSTVDLPNRPVFKSRTQLFPPSHDKNSRKKEEQSINKTVDPSNTVLDNRLPLSAIKDDKTPYKKTEEQQQFVTPSTRLYSSINPNSILSTIERDPMKQPMVQQQPKILFRTPVARPFSSSIVGSQLDPKLLSSMQKLSPIKEPDREKLNENCITINKVDYVIDKKIGAGGSSSVFLARGYKSGKECAIKLVNLDGDAQVIEGYLNETKLLAKLQGNINVVALYDYCHSPEKKMLYMVMEKGESDLHKILQKFTSHIPLYTLMNYWHQMLQAVNFIHQNGVIHSDLKPANFLSVNGRLKLIDFGIASSIAIDSTSIIKFSQAGTFNYISPEALIDTSNDDSPSTHHQPKIRLSTKSDVWSLGCILYLLLYMKTPFSHIKSVHQKIHALTNPQTVIEYPKLPNYYPEMLLCMLKKCLIHNPKERSSVADLLKYPFHMIIPIEK